MKTFINLVLLNFLFVSWSLAKSTNPAKSEKAEKVVKSVSAVKPVNMVYSVVSGDSEYPFERVIRLTPEKKLSMYAYSLSENRSKEEYSGGTYEISISDEEYNKFHELLKTVALKDVSSANENAVKEARVEFLYFADEKFGFSSQLQRKVNEHKAFADYAISFIDKLAKNPIRDLHLQAKKNNSKTSIEIDFKNLGLKNLFLTFSENPNFDFLLIDPEGKAIENSVLTFDKKPLAKYFINKKASVKITLKTSKEILTKLNRVCFKTINIKNQTQENFAKLEACSNEIK